MKTTITEQVEIEKLVPGGQGIGVLKNGKKAFIWGALPGEKIEFEVTKNKKFYCEGITENIISDISPQRIKAKDPCYLSTSPWQIMGYDYELEQKQQLVVECFKQSHIDATVQPVATDNKDFYYRNKMEYALFWDNEEAKIYPAFRKRGSHQKIPIKQSSIERPEIFQEAERIIQDLNDKHEEARKYQSLLIRCNQKGEVSSALFENGKAHPKMQNLQDTILGHEYSYSPNGFFQINLPVYELALKEIKKRIDTQNVLDLYAGVGSIGLSVTNPDQTLVLVESNKDAFQELFQNCKKESELSKMDKGTIFSLRGHPQAAAEAKHAAPVKTGGRDAGRTKKILNPHPILDKSENVPNYIQPDQTVILDPPRAGCDAKLIVTLNQIKPQTIIYLSCNPITQARDIALLKENYKIEKLQPYNFFPRTPHIENLAILRRK